ncbi:hypothetical protein PtA15_2A772 [Puccinia triticina]|uniref:TNFR-Cys domain-containing protein n=1 Tax=Puccinia triticina TaxID=208348 RepID=A0ABY7CCG7_9BASI|nr:uncharacterized protein PtA15_2A772 [Puccinia triticina]WAQ82455.1 hypothetical protein PtA15_2A772 [Puccinia triticina]
MPSDSPASRWILLLTCVLSLISPIICLHEKCPGCEGSVGLVPFEYYCGRQLTCRCGSPITDPDRGLSRQCLATKKGTRQTCKAGCGWRDDDYEKLCRDEDHEKEPCQYPVHDHPSATIRASFEIGSTALFPDENHLHEEPASMHEAHPSLTTPGSYKSGSSISRHSSFASRSGRSASFSSESTSPDSAQSTPLAARADTFASWEFGTDFINIHEGKNSFKSVLRAEDPNTLQKN